MTRIIEVTIDPSGHTTIQTKGFVGGNCQDASRLLEQALGQTTSDVRTPEYFKSAPLATEQHQKS